jgi:hypothetical protein
MTQAGLVQRLVLNTICDDFENVAELIGKMGQRCS